MSLWCICIYYTSYSMLFYLYTTKCRWGMQISGHLHWRLKASLLLSRWLSQLKLLLHGLKIPGWDLKPPINQQRNTVTAKITTKRPRSDRRFKVSNEWTNFKDRTTIYVAFYVWHFVYMSLIAIYPFSSNHHVVENGYLQRKHTDHSSTKGGRTIILKCEYPCENMAITWLVYNWMYSTFPDGSKADF